MKNVWFILVMIMGFSALGSTQTDNPKRDERVKKYRIAFLTESLQLTSTEAEGFFSFFTNDGHLFRVEHVEICAQITDFY